MPPKKCASCEKTVYPVEELKCLDRTWHKACFKCQVCKMTLNMKNYKGYDKLPYCNAHYPETKFTAVAETPESKRLAQNSKIQSNVIYHSDFESSKGQYTFTSDNPEMQRHLANTQNTSLIKYHEEYEKERGQYTSVADDPETLRVRKNMETISNVAYHGDMLRRQEMENIRPNQYEPEEAPPRSYTTTAPASYPGPPTSYTAPPPARQPPAQQPAYQQQSMLDFSQPVPIDIPYDYRPPVQGPKSYTRPVMTISKGDGPQAMPNVIAQPMAPPSAGYGAPPRRPGNINDYDPMTGGSNVNSPYSNKVQSTTAYNSQAQTAPQMRQQNTSQYSQRSSQGNQYDPRSSQGSSYDQRSSQGQQYDQRSSQGHVMGGPQSYGGGAPSYKTPSPAGYNPPPQQAYNQPPQQSYTQSQQQQPYRAPYQPAGQQQSMAPPPQQPVQPRAPPPAQQRAPPAPRDPYAGKGRVSKAMYDYSAADDDEVTFGEDDLIIHCEPIDEGWMTGTVEKTGQHGMLPSNYVEHLNW